MSKIAKFIEENLAKRAEHKRKVLAGNAEPAQPMHPHVAYQMAGSMGSHDVKNSHFTHTDQS